MWRIGDVYVYNDVGLQRNNRLHYMQMCNKQKLTHIYHLQIFWWTTIWSSIGHLVRFMRVWSFPRTYDFVESMRNPSNSTSTPWLYGVRGLLSTFLSIFFYTVPLLPRRYFLASGYIIRPTSSLKMISAFESTAETTATFVHEVSERLSFGGQSYLQPQTIPSPDDYFLSVCPTEWWWRGNHPAAPRTLTDALLMRWKFRQKA